MPQVRQRSAAQHRCDGIEGAGDEGVVGPHAALVAGEQAGVGEDLEASDVVITMGCGDACPVFPGKRYLDWDLADPAGRGLEAVRPVRDEIGTRIRGLLAELDVVR